MVENRCPECEELLTDLDCLDCLTVKGLQRACIQIAAEPKATTHCRNGHLRTDENTTVKVRADKNHRTFLECKDCRREAQKRRVRSQVGIDKRKKKRMASNG